MGTFVGEIFCFYSGTYDFPRRTHSPSFIFWFFQPLKALRRRLEEITEEKFNGLLKLEAVRITYIPTPERGILETKTIHEMPVFEWTYSQITGTWEQLLQVRVEKTGQNSKSVKKVENPIGIHEATTKSNVNWC